MIFFKPDLMLEFGGVFLVLTFLVEFGVFFYFFGSVSMPQKKICANGCAFIGKCSV